MIPNSLSDNIPTISPAVLKSNPSVARLSVYILMACSASLNLVSVLPSHFALAMVNLSNDLRSLAVIGLPS